VDAATAGLVVVGFGGIDPAGRVPPRVSAADPSVHE